MLLPTHGMNATFTYQRQRWRRWNSRNPPLRVIHACSPRVDSFRFVTLIPSLKIHASGSHFAIDVLVPKNSTQHYVAGIRATLSLIDCYSRKTHCLGDQNYIREHLMQQTTTTLQNMFTSPQVCIADRHSAVFTHMFAIVTTLWS